MWRLIILLTLIVASVYLLFKGILFVTEDKTRPHIDPALETVVHEWEESMHHAGIEYRPRFNQLEVIARVARETPWAGRTSRATRSIEINQRQVESGQYRLLCTVYHELGHFTFNLEHGSGIMQEECPSEEYLAANWNRLVEEYIEECRNNKFNANPTIP